MENFLWAQGSFGNAFHPLLELLVKEKTESYLNFFVFDSSFDQGFWNLIEINIYPIFYHGLEIAVSN